MTLPEQFRSTRPPWVHLVVLDRGDRPTSARSVPAGFIVRTIDGRRARTKRGLLAEFARALAFPDGAGRNWDAFEELLTDLEWLPAKGYLLVITDADQLLAEDADEYDTFIGILNDVGREWAAPRGGERARPAMPFHVHLVVAREHEGARPDWRVPRL